MNSHSCEALVLRTYPFSEANKVVVALTRQVGILRGVAYGARKSRNRFGSSLEPLTHVRMAYTTREHQELAVIQNCEIICAFAAKQADWEVSLHLGYFSELLVEFSREQNESEKLFRLALAVLTEIPNGPVQMLARYFEFWILKLEGVLPALDRRLDAQLAAKTAAMLRQPPAQIRQTRLEGGEMKQLERLAEELIEYHLEKPLKSRKIIRQFL